MGSDSLNGGCTAMLRKATAILLAILMIFQMMPTAVLAEMVQEDADKFQVVESNDLESKEPEEAFEVNFVLEENAAPQASGQKKIITTRKTNGKKGGEGSPRNGGDGSRRIRRKHETVGTLPDAPNKKHLYRWYDKQGKRYVDENTEVTYSMTLTPVGTNEESLSLSDGGVSVEVPADSVPENTEFSACADGRHLPRYCCQPQNSLSSRGALLPDRRRTSADTRYPVPLKCNSSR